MLKTEEISFTDFRVCFNISILFLIFCIVFQRECTQQFDGSVHVSSTWITMNNRKKSDAYNNSKQGNRFYKNNLASRTVCKVYSGENWKLNFISTVGSTVRNTDWIRHENGALRKRSSNRKNLKTPAFEFSFSGEHKTLRQRNFPKTMGTRFPARVFLKH